MNLTELVNRLKNKVNSDIQYTKGDVFFDFYTNINWGADSVEVWDACQSLISDYKREYKGFKLSCSCDISPYEHFMVEQLEPNYLTITITIDETLGNIFHKGEILNAYYDCLEYFEPLLPDYTHLLIP